MEREPARKDLGAIQGGSLLFQPGPSGPFDDEHGILIRFDRDDGKVGGLAWRRNGSADGMFLGWTENGLSVWSRHPVDTGRSPIVVSVSRDGAPIGDVMAPAGVGGPGRIMVEMGTETLLAMRTDFFSSGTAHASGAGGGEWSGTALLHSLTGSSGEPAPEVLPGRIRLGFLVPVAGRISSSPILEAGRVGAADSLYLRALSDGRYVIGLDHWSVGAAESAPFELAAGELHALVIEMTSLETGGATADGTVRVSLDGRMVMNRRTQLYPVLPGEVVFGRNPLGMSTSAAAFEGDLISVRLHQSALVPAR